ncbi:alpha/beta-hydrolase [Patellaria atrata CBS 101060]|uniref:Carboxylic ester hydrolase n=1 Tax=Patellaria atrata CBS 101060 TaxID=1346257 RepID=A0A9P4S6H3_9PEZI|nr:alpha/beta-hydrolase [Patellaria atrata CBS 101060]
MRSLTASVFLTIQSLATAIPSPLFLKSPLTILSHNTLSPSPPSAILLSTPQTHGSAIASCAALNETLFSGNATELPLSEYGEGPFWVFGLEKACMAVDAKGRRKADGCGRTLPALCNNSAGEKVGTAADGQGVGQEGRVVVRSKGVEFVGYRDKFTFRFLGLRYASTPARFTYSTLHRPGPNSNLSALSFGPSCPQPACASPRCSEDCLFLNIWTPYLPSHAPSPLIKLKAVMLWFHGGGMYLGSGSDANTDGGNLASRGDVVVVSINYRLGALGYLALKGEDEMKGNYGVSDQLTAIDWIKANIRDFGGDPERITVFGQSGGAVSIAGVLASPKSRGNIEGAIMMSRFGGLGLAKPYSEWMTIAEEEELTGKPILNATGCMNATSKIECLRAYDAFKLADMADIAARYLVIDGEYITTTHLPVDGSGHTANIRLMHGTLRDEGGAMLPSPSLDPETNLGFLNLVEDGRKALASGAFNSSASTWNTTVRIATDAQFRCDTYATAYSAALHDVFAAQYVYEMTRSFQMPDWPPAENMCQPLSGNPRDEYFKCHSGDLVVAFGNVERVGQKVRDELDIPFSQLIVDSWAAFARTGKPDPEEGFLRARGYANTTALLRRMGKWEPFQKGMKARKLDPVSGGMVGLGERVQCGALDYPIDYFER